MEESESKKGFFIRNGWLIVLPLLFLMASFLFRTPLYGVFKEYNYVTIHLLIEIFLIVSSLTISIQAWLIFPYILSNVRLYIGALFFSLGLLEIAHTLTYQGMPFFISESSTYSATWFYIITRLTQALGLFFIILVKKKNVYPLKRWLVYSLAFLYVFILILMIFYPNHLLPELVIAGQGTTALKKGLQSVAIGFQLLTIFYLIRRFHKNKTRNMLLILASIYLVIGDGLYMMYVNVYDIVNFSGHLFQLLGYYCLLRVLYYSSVEEPFQAILEKERQLLSSKKILQHMAYYDELTGLPNARYFSEELSKELPEDGTKKAVIVIEIDRYAFFKDSLGPIISDRMTENVAARLRKSLPQEIFISKMRGEEFKVFLRSIEGKEELVKVCQLLQEVMKKPFQIEHYLLNITINIGIAIYPHHGKSEEELLKHAQVAVREAQKVSERYFIYQLSMDQKIENRLLLEHDLHQAMERGELFLEYQPQVDLLTGRIFSVEALLRWNHFEKGIISPAEFIPIAEETGLIIPIGEWILETACHQVRQWNKAGITNIKVAVNLSIGQFFQQNFIQTVENILAKTKIDPCFLELEITESMTMDIKYTTEVLYKLKNLGVSIAVDDFGTGYSSLTYLKDLPIDCLKIDQSFVRNVQSNLHNATLTSMIISMAKYLQLNVVAEGVEKVEQLAFLGEKQCDTIQGFLFSRPISAEDLTNKYHEIQKRAISILNEEMDS